MEQQVGEQRLQPRGVDLGDEVSAIVQDKITQQTHDQAR
jgi:hypothetical protein